MTIRELINKLEELNKGQQIKLRIRDWDGFEIVTSYEELEIGYDENRKEYIIY